jgi:hypothetical protein
MRPRRLWETAAAALLYGVSAHAEPPPAEHAPSHDQRREPSAGDLATARAALREGLALRDKGESAQALVRLSSAYDLVPTPVTGFELGKTHMMLGHVLQAHELFKKVVRMPPSMEESTRSQTSRDEAARLAKELEPRIPTLRLKLELAAGATAVVRIDEDAIPITGAVTVRAVDPGAHEIVAKAGDGPEQKVHVDLAETETKDVSLAPKWVPPKEPTANDKNQILYVRQTNPLAFVGFGVGAAALVVTGISVYIWQNARAAAADKCGHDYCPPASPRVGTLPQNGIANPDFESRVNQSNIAGLVAVVGAITTVTFLTVGIIGVSKPIKERVVSSVKPVVGPGSAGVVGTF